MSEADDRPLADRREDPQMYEDADFGEEFAPSPTDPANQPEQDPQDEVYGEDEGYEKPTEP
ncbi:hypothetical protein [Nonomuraea lactucae]|uniref:hypothetical protein n=1 Tax=Nonomuraea lactucae TaxID=2249762 RepID=UPI000DE4D9F6|nr:hypothetical protein [Nonomuraea lactucae]